MASDLEILRARAMVGGFLIVHVRGKDDRCEYCAVLLDEAWGETFGFGYGGFECWNMGESVTVKGRWTRCDGKLLKAG